MLTDAAPQKLSNSTIYLFTSQAADGSATNKQIWFETKPLNQRLYTNHKIHLITKDPGH